MEDYETIELKLWNEWIKNPCRAVIIDLANDKRGCMNLGHWLGGYNKECNIKNCPKIHKGVK